MSSSTTNPPSDIVRVNVTKIGMAVAIAAGIAGLFGAWFVLPYRMDAAEKKIEAVEIEQRQQREILIRIDENVKMIKASTR